MDKVKIRVIDSTCKFISYLIYNKINYESLECDKECYILIVNYDDYKRISRRYETNIIKYYGKRNIKYLINKNKYLIISFILSMCLLRLLSITIFDIRVNTSSIEIKHLILSSLKENGISKHKKKKSFSEIKKIKESILEKNKDKLEWIEIREKGSVYIVDVTPRVINNEKSDNKVSSIIAARDGVIKHITVSSGTRLKELGEYVKKGEVIISGNIFKDEEVIDTTKAKGEVFAETWYFTNVEVPLSFREKVYTGEIVNHIYLDILGKKFTLIGKYPGDNVESTNKLIVDKPYLLFKIYKEKKKVYKYVEKSISVKEAYKIALDKSIKKIESKLKDKEYIISKNVLKKEVNSSKMYLEVFFKVYENIGVTSEIEKIIKKEE